MCGFFDLFSVWPFDLWFKEIYFANDWCINTWLFTWYQANTTRPFPPFLIPRSLINTWSYKCIYIWKILLISSTTHQKTYRYKHVQTCTNICTNDADFNLSTKQKPDPINKKPDPNHTVHLWVKTKENVLLPPHDCDFWVVFVTPSRLFQDSVLMVMLPLVTGDKVLISWLVKNVAASSVPRCVQKGKHTCNSCTLGGSQACFENRYVGKPLQLRSDLTIHELHKTTM